MSIRTVKTGNEESIINKITIEMGFYQNYSLKLLEDVFSRAVVDELVPDLADDVLDNTDVDGARRSRHFRLSRRFLSTSDELPLRTSPIHRRRKFSGKRNEKTSQDKKIESPRSQIAKLDGESRRRA